MFTTQALAHENYALENEIGPKVQQIDMMTQQIRQKQETLAQDRWRNEYARLSALREKLKRERDSAQEDARATSLDPEEARAMMLEKVKVGKARMAQVEEQIQQVDEEVDNHKRAIAEIKSDLEERKNESSSSQKYEMLFQRDKEMTAFIDGFDEKKATEIQQQMETQSNIVALLEYASQGIPNSGKLQDMEDDLSVKDRRLETSQMTKEKLEKELVKRQMELNKINTLEDKIKLEQSTLEERLEVMASDMVAFQALRASGRSRVSVTTPSSSASQISVS